MAAPQQIKASPADKRGLGLTFLGMMSDSEKRAEFYVPKEDYEVAFGILHRRIAILERNFLAHLLHEHRPWYRRVWLKIKAFFKGERHEQEQHLGNEYPATAFDGGRGSKHRGQHGN